MFPASVAYPCDPRRCAGTTRLRARYGAGVVGGNWRQSARSRDTMRASPIVLFGRSREKAGRDPVSKAEGLGKHHLLRSARGVCQTCSPPSRGTLERLLTRASWALFSIFPGKFPIWLLHKSFFLLFFARGEPSSTNQPSLRARSQQKTKTAQVSIDTRRRCLIQEREQRERERERERERTSRRDPRSSRWQASSPAAPGP